MTRNRNHILSGLSSVVALFGLVLVPVCPGLGAVVGPVVVPAVQGEIRGKVVLPDARQRRVADRYSGGQAGAPHQVQSIPAVAYIVGAVPGHPFLPLDEQVELVQKDTTFAPALLIIPPGTTVRFPNMDPFFHNVFSYSSSQRFDLGRYPQGESKEVLFPSLGIVKVYCEVHESMRSAILILENPYHAVVGEDGAFELKGIPEGEYTLAVWHADHGLKEVVVVVPADGTVSVTVDFS